MIKFWIYRGDCFYQDPVVEKYYSTLPFNKISSNGSVDLSFGMWFDGMYKPSDVRINRSILDKGFKI